MVLAKELVDKLKKIEDFDITYESRKVKQNEIASIQTQIEFNQQVADDNSKYISKLKDLIS